MTNAPRAAKCALSMLVAAALAAPVAAAPAVADVGEPPSWQPVAATDAEQALARAQALFDPAQRVSGRIRGTDEADATLVLRDLAVALPQLDRADRRVARALLARPNGGRKLYDAGAVWEHPEALESAAGDGCSATIDLCVHWTDSGADAPPDADEDGDDVPNMVERTLAVMEDVWAAQIDDMGFRPPLADGRASHDAADTRFDVYLSDIGGKGLYGYCAPDDSRMLAGSGYQFYDLAAYCVLDEDFVEFPTNTPLENLQVTAAHEFFHAVQFAYDALEDPWFMEGTAAWVEEEIYDNVNDNRQYLGASQFNRPNLSLDSSQGMSVYGSWGFWRFLTESFSPDLMRSVWERADGSPAGPDDYSLLALRRALQALGADLTAVLGVFGLAVAAPAIFLEEGAQFPSALARSFRLTSTGDSTGWRRFTLNHLSFAPVRFVPGSQLRADAQLSIRVDLPSRSTSPVAYLMVVRRDGSTSAIRQLQLNRRGVGSIRVGFAPDTVRRVLLTLGNASDDYRRCYDADTQFACGGIPLHDNLRYDVRAVVL